MEMQLETQRGPEATRIQSIESDAFAAAPLAMLVTDSSFRIITANRAAIRFLSREDSDLSERSIFDYCVPEDSSLEIDSCAESLRSRRYGRFLPAADSSDEVRVNQPIDISITDLNNDKYLLVCEQAAYSDKSVVELDRMLTRGEMTGEIAHEMNNYLTILLGNVEIIPIFCEKKNCDVTLKKIGLMKIGLMKETLEKISSLSEKLAAYGKSQKESIIADISGHIQSILDFFIPQNRFDGIQIETDYYDGLPPIRGDIGKLQQAVGNLLHNAADEVSASGVENPTVTVVTRLSDDSNHVMISVSDNGRGIPEQIKPQIFNRRVSMKESGEGYGLLTVKKIVDTHSGRITFKQNESGGSTFTIMLPTTNSSKTVAAKP
jgi:signal transduction histidine kinase